MNIEVDCITEVEGYEDVKWPTAIAYTPSVGEYISPTSGKKPPLQISKVIHARVRRGYDHVGYCGEVFRKEADYAGLKLVLTKTKD